VTESGPGPDAGTAAVVAVGVIAAWLRCAAGVVHERRAWLTELDAAIGDGDHGINLDRGLTAVAANLDAMAADPGDPGDLLVQAGRRILGLVGGASGALYGRGLMVAGARLRDATAATHAGPGAQLLAALEGAVDGIAGLGHAVPGDKTMLDALVPARDAVRDSLRAGSLPDALAAMVAAAEAGAASTTPLVARKGRASYLGERSAGHLDPGAASSVILVRCLAEALAGPRGRAEPEA
jgi:dihydroxyacetone kinase-like protein